MNNLLQTLKNKILKRISITEQKSNSLQLFYECLNQCYSLEDITTLQLLVHLRHSNLSFQELTDLLLNIDYRKRILEYALKNLTKPRYSAMEIKRLFNYTDSYAVCDAILMHVEINKQNYLSVFQDMYAMTSTEVFTRMAIRRKKYILENYTKKNLAS